MEEKVRLCLLNYLSIRLKSGYGFGRLFFFFPNVGKGRIIKYKEEKLSLKNIPIKFSPLEHIIAIHHLEVDMELHASEIQEEVITSIS